MQWQAVVDVLPATENRLCGQRSHVSLLRAGLYVLVGHSEQDGGSEPACVYPARQLHPYPPTATVMPTGHGVHACGPLDSLEVFAGHGTQSSFSQWYVSPRGQSMKHTVCRWSDVLPARHSTHGPPSVPANP